MTTTVDDGRSLMESGVSGNRFNPSGTAAPYGRIEAGPLSAVDQATCDTALVLAAMEEMLAAAEEATKRRHLEYQLPDAAYRHLWQQNDLETYEEYVSEPEPTPGLIYFVRTRVNGRSGGGHRLPWMDCGSRRPRKHQRSQLRVRYQRHGFFEELKRVIISPLDANGNPVEGDRRLVHIAYRHPKRVGRASGSRATRLRGSDKQIGKHESDDEEW